MIAISLGWGTQSFGLAAMSALGVLPRVDVAIHADTTHERTATYEFARRWTPWLEEHGVRVVTVRAENPEPVDQKGAVSIPAFTRLNGRVGRLWRQCTYEWKIMPVRRWLQEHRNGEVVELWLGITLDEATRMRASSVRYIVNRYPFLEPERWEGRMLRRSDVVRWLRDNLGDEAIPPRSACVFCPYQSRAEWRWLRDHAPQDWSRALQVDRMIRENGRLIKGELFLVRNCIPLEQYDLSTPQDHGQLSFWEEECSGMCGL